MLTTKDLRGSDLQTFNYPPGLVVNIEGFDETFHAPKSEYSFADAVGMAWQTLAHESIGCSLEEFTARITVLEYNEREPRIKVRIV